MSLCCRKWDHLRIQLRVMFIYSRILTKKKGKVMRAEMSSVQLIWIHISLHFLIYLFKFFFNTESFWLLMLIAQQSLVLSAGREDDREKIIIAYKTKSTALGGKVEKNTNNGMKQKQNAMFHKKMNIWIDFQCNSHDRHLYCYFFLVMSVRVAEGQWGGGLWVKRCPWCSG